MLSRFSLAVFVLVCCVGCTGGSSSSGESSTTSNPSSTTAKPDGKFKVALLTPGPISDAGWSAMAYEGLTGIKDEMGAEVNNQEAQGTKIKDAMRSYAQQGYQLVFGHGFEYNDPAIEVAKDFPNTVFVSSSGGKTAKNVGAFRFYLEQGFYLCGMMAAEMSKSGVVAMIGGPDIPPIHSTFDAFAAGAKAVKPGIRVIESFTGKEADIAAAKNATLAAIGEGADFVIHQANAAAQGVFDACKERAVHAFGANLNQNDNASGAVIASAVISAKPAFLKLATDVQGGKFEGAIVLMGMDIGAIDFVINPAQASMVPPAIADKLKKAATDIKAGKLIVPKMEF